MKLKQTTSNRSRPVGPIESASRFFAHLALVVILTTPSFALASLASIELTDQMVAVAFSDGDDKSNESATSKTANTDVEKPQKTELARRMESLAKSIEKEERPEIPKFENRKKRNGNSITFDDIKFDMEKGQRFRRTMLTDDINDLVGQRLKIKGYIRPSVRQKGLTKFIFVRDDKECCFGPGAALFDCVLVVLREGMKSDYTVRPITIEGEFFLKEFKGPDGRDWAVYRMKNTEIK